MIQLDRTCQHQHTPINDNDSARHQNIFYQLWSSLNLYRSEQVNINTTLPMIVIQPHNRTCDHQHTPTTDMIQSDIRTCQHVLHFSKHWSPHTTSKRRNSFFFFSFFTMSLLFNLFHSLKKELTPNILSNTAHQHITTKSGSVAYIFIFHHLILQLLFCCLKLKKRLTMKPCMLSIVMLNKRSL